MTPGRRPDGLREDSGDCPPVIPDIGGTWDGSGYESGQLDGVVLTSPTSNNTKGDWVSLIASTAIDANELVISVKRSAASRSHLVDIGIGGSGNSVSSIIIPNLLVTTAAAALAIHHYRFPVPLIPAGTRIAARYQTTDTSLTNCRLGLQLGFHSWGPVDPGTIVAMGVDTATSLGTTVVTQSFPATTWTEITASTTDRLQALWIVTGWTASLAADMTNNFDLATGPAASESLLIPRDFFMLNNGIDHQPRPVSGPFPVDVAAGTRLAARISSSFASQNVATALYGMTVP